jgi:hypothetical protein
MVQIKGYFSTISLNILQFFSMSGPLFTKSPPIKNITSSP